MTEQEYDAYVEHLEQELQREFPTVTWSLVRYRYLPEYERLSGPSHLHVSGIDESVSWKKATSIPLTVNMSDADLVKYVGADFPRRYDSPDF